MLDFILNVLSGIIGLDMRDHHNIPFALPMYVFGFLGLLISRVVLSFVKVKEE